MNKPKLIISRGNAYADRLRNYKILVDGKVVGEIADSESKDISIEPGEHEIYLKIDWGRSNKITFNASDNQTLAFKCSNSVTGTRVFLAVFYAFFMSHKYLKLEQQ